MPSHTFGMIVIGGDSTVSNGNSILNSVPTNEHGVNRAGIVQPIGNSHDYRDIIINGHAKVHNGNNGFSVGHNFRRIQVGGCAVVRNGDQL
jgi:hypothetical protein